MNKYIFFNEKQDPKMIGVSDELMQLLDKARALAGIPFVITSGVRTIFENIQAGGVIDSAHLKGLAVDLRVDTSRERYLILKALFCVGLRRIEATRSHIHVDIDDTKADDVFWVG